MKQLRVLLKFIHPPGWDASPLQGYPRVNSMQEEFLFSVSMYNLVMQDAYKLRE